MRLTAAAIAFLVTTPVAAETPKFPVSIPQECFELAQREGVPTTIENKYQATKAKFRLAQLSKADPLVRECRAAVHRAQEAMAASGSQQATATVTAPAPSAPLPVPNNQPTVAVGAQH
jgi:hypothetical protein